MKLFLALLALVATFSLSLSSDTTNCDDLYAKWKIDVDSLSTTYCLNMTQVDCQSKKCIDRINKLVKSYQDNLVGMCGMDMEFSQKNKEELQEYSKLMKRLQNLPGCNQCVVKYSQMMMMKDEAISMGCIPTTTDPACNPGCGQIKQSYIEMWTDMISNVCHMHMPGGCGKDGGITEGEIYDLLSDMSVDINRMGSSVALCNNCGATLKAWYSQWVKLGAELCISSEDIDFVTQDPSLASFKLTAQCTPSCKESVGEVIKMSYTIPPQCRMGLVGDHISQITNSVNDKVCNNELESWGFVQSKTAKAFFTLTTIGIILFSSYFLIKCIKRRKTTKEGQDTVWKQQLPKSEMKNRHDDEKGLIYTLEEDDDDEKL